MCALKLLQRLDWINKNKPKDELMELFVFRRPDWSEVSWGWSHRSPIGEKPYTYIDAPDIWSTRTLLIWTIVTNTYTGDHSRLIRLATVFSPNKARRKTTGFENSFYKI